MLDIYVEDVKCWKARYFLQLKDTDPNMSFLYIRL